MKHLKRVMISTALLALPLSALADNDGRGHGRHGHERQFKHHDHRPHFRHDRHDHHRHHDHYVRQERVYVPAVVQAPPVVYPQGVTIHGNVHVPF